MLTVYDYTTLLLGHEGHCPWHCGLIAVRVWLMNVNQVSFSDVNYQPREKVRGVRQGGLYILLAIK